jgi:hypothetical protein
MPPNIDLFASEHNRKIKWDHLLWQTRDSQCRSAKLDRRISGDRAGLVESDRAQWTATPPGPYRLPET